MLLDHPVLCGLVVICSMILLGHIADTIENIVRVRRATPSAETVKAAVGELVRSELSRVAAESAEKQRADLKAGEAAAKARET